MDFTLDNIYHNASYKNDDVDHCQDALYSTFSYSFIFSLASYSIAVFVLYSLLQRRKALCQDCCFGGYCGLPVPINFIHETKDRWVYCAAFGMLVNLFIVVVIRVSVSSAGSLSQALSAAFTVFFSMMVLPLYLFALIASIHGPLEPLSHLIGFIYTVLSFVSYVKPCATCIHYANDEPQGIEFLGTTTALQIVSCVPLLLCNGIVLVYFAVRGTYVLILRILRKPLPKQENIDHCLGYVRRLLRGSQTALPDSVVNKYLYKWDPYFKYSVRLLSVFTVIFIALLVLSIQVAFITTSILHTFKQIITDNTTIKWTDVLETVYRALLVIGFIVPLISFAMIVIPLIISLATYRRNCKQLWKGDRSFMPKIKKQSPTSLLHRSVFMFGRQLAMAFWAWIFYTVILFIVLIVLAGLIITMVFVDSFKSNVLRIIYSLILTFGVSIAIYYCEMLFVYCVFADRSVLVDNRRLFHLYTYFFLFYNSVSSVLAIFRRILTSSVVALLLLPRLDHPLVIGGLEFLDKGYTTYLAYIQVEAAYTNPVLNVFIHLLMTQTKPPRKTTFTVFSGIINPSGRHYGSTPLMDANAVDDGVIVNKVARRRWQLMYTLLRNPELIELRKGFVPCTDAATAWSNK